MKSGIYIITNIINKKIYIGSTINFKKRWIKHKTELRTKKHHSKHLEKAWHLYGEENFEFKILEEVENIDNLADIEQKYLNLYKPFLEEIGYNVCQFAENVKGCKRSEEAKIHLSKTFNLSSVLNQKIADEIRQKYKSGLSSHRKLAKQYNTSKTTIKEIIHNIRWVNENYTPPEKNLSKKTSGKKILTDEQVQEVLNLRKETNMTIKEIAMKFKVKVSVINRIIYIDSYKKYG